VPLLLVSPKEEEFPKPEAFKIVESSRSKLGSLSTDSGEVARIRDVRGGGGWAVAGRLSAAWKCPPLTEGCGLQSYLERVYVTWLKRKRMGCVMLSLPSWAKKRHSVPTSFKIMRDGSVPSRSRDQPQLGEGAADSARPALSSVRA